MTSLTSPTAPINGHTMLDGQDDVFVFPASFAQERFWFLHQLAPESAAYNIPTAVQMSGLFNIVALQQSLNEIVRRHETLRTAFVAIDGRPMQVIVPMLTIPMPVLDLRQTPQSEREQEMQRLAIIEARKPFDLAHGPLLRTTMLQFDDAEHVLLLTMHHIVSDGWAIGIFIRELSILYEAFAVRQPGDHGGSPLPELPIQYADFAHWQQQWLQAGQSAHASSSRNDARMPHCLRWGGMASLLGGLGDRFPQHDRDLPSKAPPLAAGIFTPMDGGIVHDHNGLFGDRATKRIKTGNHHACVDRLFKPIGMQIILAIHKPQDIDPTIAPGRQFDDALGLLPGVGNRGIKRKAGFIKIIEVNLSFVFLFL